MRWRSSRFCLSLALIMFFPRNLILVHIAHQHNGSRIYQANYVSYNDLGEPTSTGSFFMPLHEAETIMIEHIHVSMAIVEEPIFESCIPISHTTHIWLGISGYVAPIHGSIRQNKSLSASIFACRINTGWAEMVHRVKFEGKLLDWCYSFNFSLKNSLLHVAPKTM